jgi:hypothetical protein
MADMLSDVTTFQWTCPMFHYGSKSPALCVFQNWGTTFPSSPLGYKERRPSPIKAIGPLSTMCYCSLKRGSLSYIKYYVQAKYLQQLVHCTPQSSGKPWILLNAKLRLSRWRKNFKCLKFSGRRDGGHQSCCTVEPRSSPTFQRCLLSQPSHWRWRHQACLKRR